MATFTNQATLSYNGIVTNSNVVTGELLEVLSANKTALTGTYAPGDTVTYVVNIVNDGTAPFTGLTVTDDLGGYTVGTATVYPLAYVDGSARYFVNGVLQATPTVTAGPPLVFTGVTVPADGNATLVYEARVTEFAPPTTGGTVVNTATVSGGGLTTPVTGDATIGIDGEPRLTISKSLTPTAVAENGQLTYTFVIQNYGNTPAETTDNVAITDTFDPVLDNIAVTLDGATLATPADYTYTAGTFATVPGRITVPAATFTQDPVTGVFTTTPGVAVLTVTGTV